MALWKKKMNNCSDEKLQTYTKVKTSFGCEKYLKLIRNSTPKALVNSAVQEKLKMKYILFSNVLNMNQTGKN